MNYTKDMEVFRRALHEHDLDRARRMLQMGHMDVNGFNTGQPPLHFAVEDDNLPAVELLLEHGVDVSFKYSGWTALHLAVFHYTESSYDICKLLLDSGANFNELNKTSETPICIALACSNMKIVQLLLDYGADIESTTSNGWTAVHKAAWNTDDTGVLQFVLQKGFDIESRNSAGYTALHEAALCGNYEGCESLLEHGAMVNRKSSVTGHSPLSLTVARRTNMDKTRTIQVLLDYGADVFHKVKGNSILKIAQGDKIDDSIRDVLVQHIAKIKHLNVEINQEDQQIIKNDYFYEKYYQKCL